MSFLQAVLFFQPLPHFHFSLGKQKFLLAHAIIFPWAGKINSASIKNAVYGKISLHRISSFKDERVMRYDEV